MTRFPTTTIEWKLRLLWGSFAIDRWGARIGKLVSIAIIIGFSIGATYFFRSLFSRLMATEGIGEPLLWRVVSITLSTLFGLMIVSNLITGIATLFKSSEVAFLMARPLSHEHVFVNRFLDNLGYSSWSLAVLGIPLLVAWGQTFQLDWTVILSLLVFGFAPLVLIAAELGTGLLIILVHLARWTSSKFVIILVTAIIILVIGYAVSQRNEGLIIEGGRRTSSIEHYLADLTGDSRTPYTPSMMLSQTMHALRKDNHQRATFLMLMLTLTSGVFLFWLISLAKRIYYNSWTIFGELGGHKSGSMQSAAKFTRGWLPNPVNAMLRKDLLQFVRNPSQWAQFLILIAFLLIYLFNLDYISSKFIIRDQYWKTLILFLNFAFSGFILATLSVRFVFPLISLEGRGFWVVRSAPVTVDQLFWEKFFLAFVVFMGLCELIVYFANHVLNLHGPMATVTTAATFTMGAALTALAIGMGALFPDFRDESPMRIASTPGGVVTVIVSLVYVALMVAIMAWPTQGYVQHLTGQGPLPLKRALQALGLLAGLNALVLLLPVSQGRQMLASKDL